MLIPILLFSAVAALLAAGVLVYRGTRVRVGSSGTMLAVGLTLMAGAVAVSAVTRSLGIVGPMLFLLAALMVAVSAFHLSASLSGLLGTDRTQGSEPEFRRLVEHGWDAFVLVDADGVITFASESVRRLLGPDATAVVGRSVFDAVFRGEVDALRGHLADVLRQPGRRAFHDIRTTRDDGSPVWLEVTWTNLLDDASIRGVVVNLRDITERMQGDTGLDTSASRYRSLVQQALYGVYRASEDGRFLAVNPALVRMLGYESEEELTVDDAVERVYRDPSQARELAERFQMDDRVEGVEVQWLRKDGVPISVWLSGRTLRDRDGDFVALELVAEDVTERRTLEAQLRQAQKMEAIGQLAGGIAHDFNNLLTVIIANTDIIQAVVGESDNPIKDELEDLRRSAQHGRDLVKKLLGYGRRDMLEAKPVNLVAFVRDLLPTLKRVLPASIDMRLSAKADQPMVRADPSALQQIVFNLATNARDAMPKGGTIRFEVGLTETDSQLVRWGARGEFMRLTVSDDGEGMNEETRARVFDPFFTTKPAGVGTGLGMAMIYGLVKQQDGFIDVTSKPGEGTRVELFFPTESEALEEAVDVAASGSATEGTETILVVEDESAIRRSVKRLLEGKGYRVLLAADGQEALEAFERSGENIELIVSDVVMPRMGGFELYQAIRARGDEVRFLFVSGYATPDIKRLASEASQTFLQKPWDVDDFLQNVRELLDMAGRPAA